jgi:hypothetical protein
MGNWQLRSGSDDDDYDDMNDGKKSVRCVFTHRTQQPRANYGVSTNIHKDKTSK